MRLSRKLVPASLLLLVMICPALSKADPLAVHLTAGYPAPSGPDFLYDYTLEVDPFETFVAPTNYFTIVDFAGYQPGTITAPAGWTVSTVLFDAAAAANILLIGGVDNPLIENLVFTRSAGTFGPGATSAGFRAESSNSTLGSLYYFAFHQRSNALATSTGQVSVSAVPEASNVASVAAMMVPVGLFFFVRKRSAK